MSVEEIRELIQLVLSTGISELEVQRGENRVWIKSNSGVNSQEVQVTAQTAPSAHAPAAIRVPSPAPPPSSAEPDFTDPSLEAVKAPIVGTFYESPSPGSDPFVKVGDPIEAGKILCIIESMKLMNEIEAEISGTIVKRLVENGQPVEYGEVLYLVKPD